MKLETPEQYVENLKFEELEIVCKKLGINYQEPMIDDKYPDWEDDLRGKMIDAMEQAVEL